MSHFAKIVPTQNPIICTVTEVIVAEQSYIDTGSIGDPTTWIQTSYNTRGNVHYAPSPPAEPNTPDGGTPLRGNYARVGDTYNKEYDVFYETNSPYPSWSLSHQTWLWEAPVSYPIDGLPYGWDESTLSWKSAKGPYPSWSWSMSNQTWEPPVPRPNDGKFYRWDEPTISWIEMK